MQSQNSRQVPSARGQRRTFTLNANHHKAFLSTPAKHLGMNEKDSEALVEDAVSRASHNFQWQKESLPLKVFLAKMLVRDRVFHLNRALFSEDLSCTKLFQPQNEKPSETRTVKSTMSDWLAYILCDVSGFTEREAAQIVNSTEVRIEQALIRTRSTIKKPAWSLSPSF